ncbi:MAG: Asp-tRNA(Asn)/Glu-tRNA(Gln) amidotransferase subunit GatC [Candidatus Liptonbacteria bacterium]
MPEKIISKEELSHLAKLARIRLEAQEEDKLLRDLGDILDYFEELKQLDTSGVEPISGGTYLRSVFREDAYPLASRQGKGKESFPKNQGGFLKVPPVFKKPENKNQ